MSAALTKYVTPDEVYLQARRSNIRKRVPVVFKNLHSAVDGGFKAVCGILAER